MKDDKTASMHPSQMDLSARMAREWDRRICHDYRYWMSDGVLSDKEMWQVGKRDLDILIGDADRSLLRGQRALEIGCGVGRILRAASGEFAQVVGVDVSPQAVAKARDLLADLSNVTVLLGDGVSLEPVEEASVDYLYSFAALSSMPIVVIAGYLREMSRVLKSGGIARIQLYLGDYQSTALEDTIAIRCLEKDRFVAAMQSAGFDVLEISRLVLPFEVSDEQENLIASLVTARCTRACEHDAQELARILGAEREETESYRGSRVEYLMALARAKQHIDARALEEALEALRFAVGVSKELEETFYHLLEELEALSPGVTQGLSFQLGASSHVSVQDEVSVFQQNLKVVARKFPELAAKLERLEPSRELEVSYNDRHQPILVYRGTMLDNRYDPQLAARKLLEQGSILQTRADLSSVVVAGFAGGYHLEELATSSSVDIYVVEPSLDTLRLSLSVRDLRGVLERIKGLESSVADFRAKCSVSIGAGRSEFLVHPQTQGCHGLFVSDLRREVYSTRVFVELHPTVGIVGPLYGGTLPMVNYLGRGLFDLNQQFQTYDMSGFCQGYMQLDSFVKQEKRVDTLQSEYVEMLSKVLLESLKERPVDILICLAQAPITPKALADIRAQGVVTVMWFVEDCSRFRAWESLARHFDYMFIIQKGEYPKMVSQAGAGYVGYLPTACDPTVHRPLNLDDNERRRWGSDISFVGAGYNNRRQTFAKLAGRDFKIWGTEWPAVRPFLQLVQDGARRIAPEEYTKIFNATKVNLNLHSSTERDGVDPHGDFVNPRTFELAASGAFQLVDYRSLLPELFNLGVELDVFSTTKEMEEKIDYYLDHPEERTKFAEQARKRVLSEHTYAHRLRQMLATVYVDRFEQLRERSASSLWQRTMHQARRFPELEPKLEQTRALGLDPSIDSIGHSIQLGKGNITEVESRLLFLHHIKRHVGYVRQVRSE